jgi:hypothetical protein
MKGQIWSVDLIAGLVAFLFIMLVFILVWNSIAIRWKQINDYRQMQADALIASETLMTTSGEPKGWEMMGQIDNAWAIGIVDARGQINPMKVERLIAENASYDFIRERLGLQRYGFGLNITDLERNQEYYRFGRFSGLNNSVVYERLGLLNGTPVLVRIEVWR